MRSPWTLECSPNLHQAAARVNGGEEKPGGMSWPKKILEANIAFMQALSKRGARDGPSPGRGRAQRDPPRHFPSAPRPGRHLLADIDTVNLGYRCTEHASDKTTHVVLTK